MSITILSLEDLEVAIAPVSTPIRSFSPTDCGNTTGRNVALTIDEAKIMRHGRESDAVEFFDKRSNRDIRAVMGSNRARFLS